MKSSGTRVEFTAGLLACCLLHVSGCGTKPPPAAALPLSVEETIGAALTMLQHQGGGWNVFKRANRSARPALYRILAHKEAEGHHPGVWGILGYIGDEADLKKLENALENDFTGLLANREGDTLKAMFSCLGLMCRRDVPGAAELVDRIAKPDYWEKTDIRWFPESRKLKPGRVYNSLSWVIWGYAYSGKDDINNKIASILATIDDPELKRHMEHRISPRLMSQILQGALEAEKKPITPEMRKHFADAYRVKAALFADEEGADIDAGDFRGCTQLYRATQGNSIDIMKLAIRKGANVNAKCWEGETPLHQARSREAAELLVANGADLGAKDRWGHTPLHINLPRRPETCEVVALLIEKGADVNARDKEGDTPLHQATTTEVAKLLIDSGAEVDAKNRSGMTPLDEAADLGRKDVVELLIASGAKVGSAALSLAAEQGLKERRDIVLLLIANGADVNAKSTRGMTPLHRAVNSPSSEVVEILVANGADVNAKDVSGATPLFDAAQFGRMEVAKFLISKGAKIDIKDRFGRTPLSKAKANHKRRMVKFLASMGAKGKGKRKPLAPGERKRIAELNRTSAAQSLEQSGLSDSQKALVREAYDEFEMIRLDILQGKFRSVSERLLDNGRVIDRKHLERQWGEFAEGLEVERQVLRSLEGVETSPRDFKVDSTAEAGEAVTVSFVLGGTASTGREQFLGSGSRLTVARDGSLIVVMKKIDGRWYWNPFGW